MPDKKKISELQSVVLGNSDYFAVAHDNSGVRESGKVSTVEIGQKVNSGIEYSGIHKEIIGHQNPIAAINDLQSYIVDSILPSDTVSGAIASLPDGADGIPVKSFKTTITPIQAGSGTPSPSNPRAISPRSQFVATQEDGNNTQIDQKTILLGDTIYGGVADITSGEVSVTYGQATLNGSESWQAVSSINGYRLTISDMKSGRQQPGWADWLSSDINDSFSITFGAVGTVSQNIYCRNVNDIPGVTDLTSWKNYLSNNNLNIVYPLDTPTESSITPEVFETVKGDNNFYTDCGDSTVEYKADVQLYIDKKTASNRSLGLMMNPMSQPEETSEEETEQEEVDNGNNQR